MAKEKNQRNEITRGDRQQDIEISEKTMPQSSWTSFVSREWWADRNPRGRAYGIQSIDSFDKRYAKWARKRGRYPLVPTPMHSNGSHMVLVWFSFSFPYLAGTSRAVEAAPQGLRFRVELLIEQRGRWSWWPFEPGLRMRGNVASFAADRRVVASRRGVTAESRRQCCGRRRGRRGEGEGERRDKRERTGECSWSICWVCCGRGRGQ